MNRGEDTLRLQNCDTSSPSQSRRPELKISEQDTPSGLKTSDSKKLLEMAFAPPDSQATFLKNQEILEQLMKPQVDSSQHSKILSGRTFVKE